MQRIVPVSSKWVGSLMIILLLGCRPGQRPLPFYDSPDFTPVWLPTNQSPSLFIQHQVGDFSLIDQNAKPVTQQTVKGKIHVANFMFTSCNSICPVMTNNMRGIQDAFAGNKDVLLLSYSVTPWADSVPRLKKYADRFGVQNDKWHLLTGNTNDIYQLARQGYFAEEETGFKKDSSGFLHTEHFMLVDRDGYLRGIYNGTVTLEMQRLIEDIDQLLRE
jgi:protein SCO1/2